METEKASFRDWDDFCEKALDKTRAQKKKNTNTSTQSRHQKINEVLETIKNIISKIGWDGFKAIVGILVGASTVALGGTVGLTIAFGPIGLIMAPVAIGLGGAAYCAVKVLINNKETVILVKNILSDRVAKFNRYFPNHPNAKMSTLFQKCIQTLLLELYKVAILDEDIPVRPICICGQIMLPTLTNNCYSNYPMVICDLCDKVIPKEVQVYHCPDNSKIHSRGFDLCVSCVRNNSLNLSKYYVLIIQPVKKDEFNDINIYPSLFGVELNFHQVTELKENQCTKDNITKEIKKLTDQMQDRNAVLIICFTGHGSRYSSSFKLHLTNDETITEEEFIQLSFQKNFLQPYSMDILLLINACHSGDFKVPIFEPLMHDLNTEQIETKKLLENYLLESSSFSAITVVSDPMKESCGIFCELVRSILLDYFKAKKSLRVSEFFARLDDLVANKKLECEMTLSQINGCGPGCQSFGNYADQYSIIPILRGYD